MFETHITCLGHTNRQNSVFASAFESLACVALSIAPGPDVLFRLSQYLITRLDPTLQLDQHAYNTLSNKLSKTEGFHKHSPLHKHTQVYTCEKHSLKLQAFTFFSAKRTHNTHTVYLRPGHLRITQHAAQK